MTRKSPNGTVLGDGVNPVRAACGDDAVTLASAQVRLPGPVSATIQQRSTSAVVGRLQLRYSAACHSTWARFEPGSAREVPALRGLLWQITVKGSRRSIASVPALRAAYTDMLMVGQDCVIAQMTVTLPTGPTSLTMTGCVTAPQSRSLRIATPHSGPLSTKRL